MSKTTLPTMESITNLYLFGKETKPTSLLDVNLIRAKGKTIDVNVNEFMQGPGRFANVKDFEFIEAFFKPSKSILPFMQTSSNLSYNLKPGTYTKQQIIQLLKIDKAYIQKTLGFYDDGKDDLVERAYIWNTSGFMIDDGATFVVKANGERYIENFAIRPYKNSRGEEENFDFQGGDWSNIVNPILADNIDPSRIGRTVDIKFTGKINTKTLTFNDYKKEVAKTDNWAVLNAAEVGLKIPNIINRLWDKGVTQSLYNGKPIIYGSLDKSNNFDGTITPVGKVDIAGMVNNGIIQPVVSSGNPLFPTIDARTRHKLAAYVKNGIAYVGGNATDTINGTAYNDILMGNGGKDTLNGKAGYDTYIADNLDIISDSDGKGEVHLNKLGKKLTGGNLVNKAQGLYKDANGTTYAWNQKAKTLTINGGLVIQNFTNGALGITLKDKAVATRSAMVSEATIAQSVSTANNLINAMSAFGSDSSVASFANTDSYANNLPQLAVAV